MKYYLIIASIFMVQSVFGSVCNTFTRHDPAAGRSVYWIQENLVGNNLHVRERLHIDRSDDLEIGVGGFFRRNISIKTDFGSTNRNAIFGKNLYKIETCGKKYGIRRAVDKNKNLIKGHYNILDNNGKKIGKIGEYKNGKHIDITVHGKRIINASQMKTDLQHLKDLAAKIGEKKLAQKFNMTTASEVYKFFRKNKGQLYWVKQKRYDSVDSNIAILSLFSMINEKKARSSFRLPGLGNPSPVNN